ncbi:MAG: Unknown protein [uncultured Sulfurovum sp.]|uniref:Uncharacterized protein n=1 Tax=uncultured Sulfurovum sp. TaxID=269237 RepID=A0A6S6SLB6_9BACT|nr:MAG: Unknown protein [uncultured Sulfurovum sp.]
MEVFYADVFYFIEFLIYATEMSGYGEPDLQTAVLFEKKTNKEALTLLANTYVKY